MEVAVAEAHARWRRMEKLAPRVPQPKNDGREKEGRGARRKRREREVFILCFYFYFFIVSFFKKYICYDIIDKTLNLILIKNNAERINLSRKIISHDPQILKI